MSSESKEQIFLIKVSKIFMNIVRQSSPYMMASYTLVGSLIGLALLGYFADRWLGTEPWLLLLGLILGLVIGLYEVARVSLKKRP